MLIKTQFNGGPLQAPARGCWRWYLSLLGFVLMGASALRAETANWPQFRGDPQSTGVARGTLPATLQLLWKFEVPKGAFEGTPAIVDGVVYLGDMDGEVYALKLATGEKIWEYKTESGFMASPAVFNGLLYIGDYDGRFYCLDTKDGSLKWGFETGAEIDSCANLFKNQILIGSQDAKL